MCLYSDINSLSFISAIILKLSIRLGPADKHAKKSNNWIEKVLLNLAALSNLSVTHAHAHASNLRYLEKCLVIG